MIGCKQIVSIWKPISLFQIDKKHLKTHHIYRIATLLAIATRPPRDSIPGPHPQRR